MKPDDLKSLRERHGITQEEAARLAMVTPRCFQHWEHGTRSMPSHRVKLFNDALADLLATTKERK